MNISANKTFKYLLAILTIMLVLHFLSQIFLLNSNLPDTSIKRALISKLNLEGEMNLSAWYTQLLHATAAFLLLAIGLSRKKQKGSYRYHWLTLSLIFLYISFDEASSIHEMAVAPTRELLNIDKGPLSLAWFIPAVSLLIITSLFFVRFWLNLPKKTRNLFAISLVIFIGGSVGMEMFSGNYYSNINSDLNSLWYTFMFASEECMEILGISIFIYALLNFIATLPKDKSLINITT